MKILTILKIMIPLVVVLIFAIASYYIIAILTAILIIYIIARATIWTKEVLS